MHTHTHRTPTPSDTSHVHKQHTETQANTEKILTTPARAHTAHILNTHTCIPVSHCVTVAFLSRCYMDTSKVERIRGEKGCWPRPLIAVSEVPSQPLCHPPKAHPRLPSSPSPPAALTSGLSLGLSPLLWPRPLYMHIWSPPEFGLRS